jgi:WhiB family transcriptional regulator, redox-sensing transcriptional regulator
LIQNPFFDRADLRFLHGHGCANGFVPSFVDVLNAREWTAEAACLDDPDPDRWFIEGAKQADQPEDSSVRVLEAMLVCAGCPVRVPCLAEAMTDHVLGGRAVGLWGGSTTRERHQLRHLPVDQAIEQLEDGLAERVRRRVEAVERKHHRRKKGNETPLDTSPTVMTKG